MMIVTYLEKGIRSIYNIQIPNRLSIETKLQTFQNLFKKKKKTES